MRQINDVRQPRFREPVLTALTSGTNRANWNYGAEHQAVFGGFVWELPLKAGWKSGPIRQGTFRQTDTTNWIFPKRRLNSVDGRRDVLRRHSPGRPNYPRKRANPNRVERYSLYNLSAGWYACRGRRALLPLKWGAPARLSTVLRQSCAWAGTSRRNYSSGLGPITSVTRIWVGSTSTI